MCSKYTYKILPGTSNASDLRLADQFSFRSDLCELFSLYALGPHLDLQNDYTISLDKPPVV